MLFISVLSIAVLFSGCTRTYIVKPFTINAESVPAIQAKDPINLINAQTSGTQNVFLSSPVIKWVGDLSEWTDQAIGLLAYEFGLRNVKVSKDAAKTLSLAVTDGKLIRAAGGIGGVRCIITLKVTAGNGYSKEFVGENINRWSPFGEQARYHAGANALTEAVIALLNDKEIIRYLQE